MLLWILNFQYYYSAVFIRFCLVWLVYKINSVLKKFRFLIIYNEHISKRFKRFYPLTNSIEILNPKPVLNNLLKSI